MIFKKGKKSSYKCEVCDKHLTELIIDFRDDKMEKEKRFLCEKCQTVWTDADGLTVGLLRCHFAEKVWKKYKKENKL